MKKKLWKGRFTKAATSSVNDFNASVGFDQKLYAQDIEGSIAHCKMLSKQNIISASEGEEIIKALTEIKEEISAGKHVFTSDQEDIHMAVEGLLIEKIGSTGKKLHTARSRNDQVATDFRLFLREEIKDTQWLIDELLEVLLEKAKEHKETIMPGYTHLQNAQPITLGYHFLAYYEMFKRDKERLEDSYKRVNSSPLGSGALAGTTYETDRDFVAEELGFERLCPNGMDAISDRDFAIEFLSNASILMMHLSRFCEEIIIWNSSQFAFIELDDVYATGSSIMPQKKNPDMAELIRGKTGRVYGSLITLLTIMKGLPLAYNKDMQEDKEPVFDAVDTIKNSLNIFKEMIETATFNKENMMAATKKGFMNATDAADYLVGKGVPFRDCHEIIGKLVLYSIDKGCALEDLSLEDFKKFSHVFEEDIYNKISLESCIANKKSKGSTSFASVEEQINKINNHKNKINE